MQEGFRYQCVITPDFMCFGNVPVVFKLCSSSSHIILMGLRPHLVNKIRAHSICGMPSGAAPVPLGNELGCTRMNHRGS
jgi:hypothetical protein